MKIAVTGGNGDLGRSLIPYLIEQGHAVVSIDRSLPSDRFPIPTGTTEYLIADVSDLGEVVSSISGCDAIVHLAAHRSPVFHPEPAVYINNTVGSYNVLYAARSLGIKRVCLASSTNALGGAFSRAGRYDYFPVDEDHPTYAEDPYSLSKWVLEQQADAFARRNEWMTIASLRFHWLVETKKQVEEYTVKAGAAAVRHLWAYTLLSEANRACLLSITAEFSGHEVFHIVAPDTAVAKPSQELIQEFYPDVPVRREMPGTTGFFDCRKAAHILGWSHQEN